MNTHESGAVTTAIVKAEHPREEQWFMLATGRPARPGWRVLAARGDEYTEVKSLSVHKSRSEALDLARKWACANPRRFPGRLFIPINLELAAIEADVPTDHDSAFYMPMFPKRMPLCVNAAEAKSRLLITKGMDKEFRRKWATFRFIPVRVDDCYRQPD